MKRSKLLILGLAIAILVFIGIGIAWENRWWNGGDDLRLGSLSETGIEIISISPERRMVNRLKIEGETKIWVPWGLGWYRADKVKRLLTQEKKIGQIDEVMFYNFGFWPDYQINGGDDDWSNWMNLWWSVGAVNTIRIKMATNSMLIGQVDIITGDLVKSKTLDEILWRDFADNRLVNEGIRVTVANGSSESGLANWLTSRLEWAGLSVVDTESVDLFDGRCRISAGAEVESSYGYQKLRKYWDCEEVADNRLVGKEVLMYLGQGFEQMIKYHSYSN